MIRGPRALGLKSNRYTGGSRKIQIDRQTDVINPGQKKDLPGSDRGRLTGRELISSVILLCIYGLAFPCGC